MSKRRKDKRKQFKNERSRQPSKPEIVEMEPTTLAAFVHVAEKEVLPLIIERNIKPAAAYTLLTHYTYWLLTDDDTPLTVEKTTPLVRMLLALWQSDFYTPSSQYPYTLKETLRDMGIMEKKEEDDTEFLQPFSPLKNDVPRGLGYMFGGVVKHPETHLWQVWTMKSGVWAFFGGYQTLAEAQFDLEASVNITRGEYLEEEKEKLSQKVQDGVSKELPDEMIQHLVKHLQRFKIEI